MDKTFAILARNNINILGIEYSEGEPQAVLFEYQWRINYNTTKWTRAAVEWPASMLYSDVLISILETVKSIRSQLEA